MLMLKNKKILITGGTGFIGKHVVQLLLKMGAEVICFSRKRRVSKQPNLRYIKCDLRIFSSKDAGRLLKKIGKVDWIIYMAASIPLISESKETMVDAKKNTLDAFLYFLDQFGDLSKKIIFSSTVDVYGSPKSIDFTENSEVAPESPYAVAKYCCEKYLEFFARTRNKKYVILRFGQVYGPQEPMVRVIPVIVDAIVNNKKFILNGSGQDRRRFLYVEDAAAAIYLAMKCPENDIFNIAGGEDFTLKQVIKRIEKAVDSKLNLQQINKNKKTLDILPNFDKAGTKLGFCPEVNFNHGIRSVVNAK